MVLSGMSSLERPIASLLLLGPTGTGKTRMVEVASEVIFGSSTGFIKVDCAEFQHSHEIAKLIGSPPGYLGHRETSPIITQENLEHSCTEHLRLSFVLFDEIEKASSALWHLLLGILDKATLTLGDNRKVDFSRTIVFMTSNLGSSEMSMLVSGGIGFAPRGVKHVEEMDRKIYRAAIDAAKRRFPVEFINRLDGMLVFRNLNDLELQRILELELDQVQGRVRRTQVERPFSFSLTREAKDFLLREGTDLKYGARHLKRAIEKYLTFPLSSLIASDQICSGEKVSIDLDTCADKLVFSTERAGTNEKHGAARSVASVHAR